MPPVFRRIITLFSLALFTLAPLGAAWAQQGQRLNLIRDAEIESDIRTFVTPIWQAAGLDPEAVEVVIVQVRDVEREIRRRLKAAEPRRRRTYSQIKWRHSSNAQAEIASKVFGT